MPRCLLFFCGLPTVGGVCSGEDPLPGGAGRNPIATSGEDPLIGDDEIKSDHQLRRGSAPRRWRLKPTSHQL